MTTPLAVVAVHDEQRHYQTKPLGTQRAQSDTFYAHAHDEDEKGGQQDVYHVLRYGHYHRSTGVLHADEPATLSGEQQHGWGTPDANIEITAGQTVHAFLCADEGRGSMPQ